MLTVKCNGQILSPTLTVRDAARIAGCGISAAYEAVRQNRWPALRITERRIVICTVPFLEMLGMQVDQEQVDDARMQDLGQAPLSTHKQESGALRQE